MFLTALSAVGAVRNQNFFLVCLLPLAIVFGLAVLFGIAGRYFSVLIHRKSIYTADCFRITY